MLYTVKAIYQQWISLNYIRHTATPPISVCVCVCVRMCLHTCECVFLRTAVIHTQIKG